MSTVADKLRKARALIADAGSWAQQDYARDAWGNRILDDLSDGGQIACFCSLGAISMAVRGYPDADRRASELLPYEKLLAASLGLNSSTEIVDWNDAIGRTQAEVLEAFDKAIALAESDQ